MARRRTVRGSLKVKGKSKRKAGPKAAQGTIPVAQKAPTAEGTPEVPEARRFVPKAAARPNGGNGTYDFLVECFGKPGTVDAAAMALAEAGKCPIEAAAEKVGAFLENAKLDPALEVLAGEGGNEGQFMVARVPQGAQRMGGSAVKKVAKKAQKTKIEKAPVKRVVAKGDSKGRGVIAAMVAILAKEQTKGSVISQLAKQFPNRNPEGMAKTFGVAIGGRKPSVESKGHKIHRRKVNDEILYRVGK